MAPDRSQRTDLHYGALEDDVDRLRQGLAAGADLNAPDARGFRPLHFAAQQNAERSTEFLLEHGAFVDPTDVHGNTPLFTAVLSSRGQGTIIGLLRRHGADPFKENAHGQTPVGLARLITNFPAAQFFEDLPDSTATGAPLGEELGLEASPVQPAGRYLDEAKAIWQTQVPKRGQAATVQGELLRAVEKLRDEASRNGNTNWGPGHERLLAYVDRHLSEPGIIPLHEQAALRLDLERVADYEHPDSDDSVYDRLSDGVVLWARAHPEPIPHPIDPALGF